MSLAHHTGAHISASITPAERATDTGREVGFSLDAELGIAGAKQGDVAESEPEETDFHPYVKVTVSTNNASKKTQALDHADMNPEWNESLLFDIPGPVKMRREGSVSQSLRSLSGLRGNLKKDHGPEEIEFTFEAWHKDDNMSLDDRIGSANLGLAVSRFRKEDHWTTRESVRLYDDRGMAAGLLYILIKWKSLNGKAAKQMGFKVPKLKTMPRGAQMSKYTMGGGGEGGRMGNELAARNASVRGSVTIVVERAVHLIDPNKVLHPHITRSTWILFASSLVVFSYMAIGIAVYLLLEGPDSTFATTPITPEVVLNGSIVQPAVYPEVKFFTSVDAMYFAVCTFTTVGYGDVVPQTQAGRLFTVVYALLGVAIVAVGINIMVFACLESGRELVEYCSRGYCRCMHCQSKHLVQRPISARVVHRRLWLMFLKIVLVIISGSLVYMIPGMMEDGKPGLAFVDSLYMCTMTASSIGYGDLHPRNQAGRTFLIFWMISGYVVMASSIREISQLYLKLKERHAEQRILNREVGQEVLGLDEDGDGEVDRYEYLAHMVVAMGKMHKREVNEIMDRFDELDKTGDGRLSRADFESKEVVVGGESPGGKNTA
jgi:voltage-gated potassium channel Kch